ncbi:hypothetical protein CSOJ01_02288 [Colletotrichum sojae]|uniref:Uncharacterized protein n=1 Tax=Colletotrichum sojae TaxID=2175907 RepID=A0A8H6N2X3_9PEZI|nr:hypothetical protein CSOJ01_02288 [Colletotrichum sojae]
MTGLGSPASLACRCPSPSIRQWFPVIVNCHLLPAKPSHFKTCWNSTTGLCLRAPNQNRQQVPTPTPSPGYAASHVDITRAREEMRVSNGPWPAALFLQSRALRRMECGRIVPPDGEPSALSNAPDARDSILRLQCHCTPSTAAVDPTAKRERSFENREHPGTDPTHRNLPGAHSRVVQLRTSGSNSLTRSTSTLGILPYERRLACSVDFFSPAHLGDTMVQRHAVFLQLDAFLPSGVEGSVMVVGISGGWASTHRSPFRDPSLWQASIEHARDFGLRARWSGLGSDHHPTQ